MVHKPDIFEESSPTQVVEGIIGKPRARGVKSNGHAPRDKQGGGRKGSWNCDQGSLSEQRLRADVSKEVMHKEGAHEMYQKGEDSS